MENTEIKAVYMLKEIYNRYGEYWEDVLGVFISEDSACKEKKEFAQKHPQLGSRLEIIEYEVCG